MFENKIKIAFFIDTIATSSAGTEKQLLYLLKGLDREQFEPHLICFYETEWMKVNQLPCPVHLLDIRRLYGPDFFKGYRQFKKLNNEIKFDLVQTFFPEGNIFGTFAGHIAGCHPIVSSRRNVGYWHNRYQVRILKFLKRWTDYYLTNSEAAGVVTVEIEGVEPNKIHTIHNGMELEKFENIPPEDRQKLRDSWKVKTDEILIGAIANLRPIKNIDKLIESAGVLCREFDNLKFVVMGEGDEREQLQNLIDRLGLTDRFLLAGGTDDVTQPLSAFDIAVLPSANESLSNSLIEYLAAGLPAVCGRVGGNPEIVEDNQSGLLYDANNIHEMTDKLRILINDPEQGKKISENGRRRAFELFSLNKMIASHQQFYLRITRES